MLTVAKKYTEGPWRIAGYAGQHDEAGAYIVDATGEHAASTTSLARNTPEGWQQYYQRANLVAAAPEMAQMLLEMHQNLDVRSETYSRVNGLLQKAGVLC
jgi:hypothetical protein